MSGTGEAGAAPGEIILEIRYFGEIQRVAAVDAQSGLEVVIQAPAGASRAEVEALALRKLARALARAASNASPRPRGGAI